MSLLPSGVYLTDTQWKDLSKPGKLVAMPVWRNKECIFCKVYLPGVATRPERRRKHLLKCTQKHAFQALSDCSAVTQIQTSLVSNSEWQFLSVAAQNFLLPKWHRNKCPVCHMEYKRTNMQASTRCSHLLRCIQIFNGPLGSFHQSQCTQVNAQMDPLKLSDSQFTLPEYKFSSAHCSKDQLIIANLAVQSLGDTPTVAKQLQNALVPLYYTRSTSQSVSLSPAQHLVVHSDFGTKVPMFENTSENSKHLSYESTSFMHLVDESPLTPSNNDHSVTQYVECDKFNDEMLHAINAHAPLALLLSNLEPHQLLSGETISAYMKYLYSNLGCKQQGIYLGSPYVHALLELYYPVYISATSKSSKKQSPILKEADGWPTPPKKAIFVNHQAGNHWNVLLFNILENSIYFYCSLSWKPVETDISMYKLYLSILWPSLSQCQWDPNVKIQQCPQQCNNYDCGIYSLMTVKRLILYTENSIWMQQPLAINQRELIQGELKYMHLAEEQQTYVTNIQPKISNDDTCTTKYQFFSPSPNNTVTNQGSPAMDKMLATGVEENLSICNIWIEVPSINNRQKLEYVSFDNGLCNPDALRNEYYTHAEEKIVRDVRWDTPLLSSEIKCSNMGKRAATKNINTYKIARCTQNDPTSHDDQIILTKIKTNSIGRPPQRNMLNTYYGSICQLCCKQLPPQLQETFLRYQVEFPSGVLASHSFYDQMADEFADPSLEHNQLIGLIQELLFASEYLSIRPIVYWAGTQFLGLHDADLKFLYRIQSKGESRSGDAVATLFDLFCLSAMLLVEFYIITTDELLRFLISRIHPSNALQFSEDYFVISFWQFPGISSEKRCEHITLRKIWIYAASSTTFHILDYTVSASPGTSSTIASRLYVNQHILKDWITLHNQYLTQMFQSTLRSKGTQDRKPIPKLQEYYTTSQFSDDIASSPSTYQNSSYHEILSDISRDLSSSDISCKSTESENDLSASDISEFLSVSSDFVDQSSISFQPHKPTASQPLDEKTELDCLSLSDVNSSQFYTCHPDKEITCHKQAWIPTQRLSFEKTTSEFKKKCQHQHYIQTTAITYDIDAVKGCVNLENFALALESEVEIFTFLSLERKLRKDSKFYMATTSTHEVKVPISSIPNLQIGWTWIPHIGKAGLYLLFTEFTQQNSGARLTTHDLLQIQNCLLQGFQLRCQHNTHADCIFGTEQGFSSIFSFRNSVPQSYEAAKARFPGELRTINSNVLPCFVNGLSHALVSSTSFGKATIYIRAIGTKHANACNSMNAIQQLLNQLSCQLHVTQFQQLIVDVAVRRWDSFTDKYSDSSIAATTWAKCSKLVAHDRYVFPGNFYSIGLTHDLNNFQAQYTQHSKMANINTPFSRRGKYIRANFYSTIHERLHDVKGMVLGGSPKLAVAWTVQHIAPGLNNTFKGNVNNLGTTIANFNSELDVTRIRINEIKSHNNGYRLEVTVPFEFAYSTLLYLDHRARNTEDFWIIPSHDLGQRLENLVLQLKASMIQILQHAKYDKSSVTKLAISEDILRNAIFFGRCWGGLSSIHTMLKSTKFFDCIQHFNLPQWDILRREKVVDITDYAFEQLLAKIAHQIRIPQNLNMLTLLDTGREISEMPTLFNKLEIIYQCYEQDLCTFCKEHTVTRDQHQFIMGLQSLSLNSCKLGILFGFMKTLPLQVPDAINLIMNTANLSLPGWKKPYLILLHSLELQHPNSKGEMLPLMAKIFLEKKVRFVHNVGKDRFWREWPKMLQIDIDHNVQQSKSFSIPVETMAHIAKAYKAPQQYSSTRGQIQQFRMHKHRIMWDEEETIRLVIGYRRYEQYKTKWAKLSVDKHLGFLNCRTNENLKDRWSWLVQDKNVLYRQKIESCAHLWDEKIHWSQQRQLEYKNKFRS